MKPRLAAIVVLVTLGLAGACATPAYRTSTDTSGDQTDESAQSDEPAVDFEPRVQREAGARGEAGKSAGLEEGVDRPGSNYREVALDEADPMACKEICDNQMRCMSFTYVRPDDRHGPLCRLKHSIADPVADQPCCVSGVNPRAQRRIAQLEAQGFELDTARSGDNFRSFEMDRDDPAECQQACDNLIECKAFTYVRPGYDGQHAHCKLMNTAGEKVAGQDCCISGLK